MVNVRTKGQTGEREIADKLNAIVATVLQELYGTGETARPVFQRNQNQSAVGGSDLKNPFWLCIEIKRQEQLSINTWWKQLVAATESEGGIPVLMFKQNRKAWRVLTEVQIPLSQNSHVGSVRAEIDLAAFEQWFAEYVRTGFANEWWHYKEGVIR